MCQSKMKTRIYVAPAVKGLKTTLLVLSDVRIKQFSCFPVLICFGPFFRIKCFSILVYDETRFSIISFNKPTSFFNMIKFATLGKRFLQTLDQH